MPEELAPDRVSDSSHEFSSKTELRAQFAGHILWIVLWLRHIPLKLVVQRNISNVYV